MFVNGYVIYFCVDMYCTVLCVGMLEKGKGCRDGDADDMEQGGFVSSFFSLVLSCYVCILLVLS